ncbi:hypothetical protein H257_18410 [Aphanomyces astaci]|uniref:Uncharacterized protein n=1 Tax=Aphanomyces astaci TaxID=112090 RepID=W4FD66_APHAT|nr:hypothetical protein H257_18410 [Aphanomyces astaci]ETV64776.1 hypothetical protein H257_18410 [Aphanomyces astaci]RQM12894.1 hypothetical protein B5M09_005104 [Aphanomyces astaci]|eukprot:XP_009845759.1 hypothetical protein H257_18410 [Aphanomyces astaci]
MNNNQEQDTANSVEEERETMRKQSTATSPSFHSASCVLDGSLMESNELKCVAVRYFHGRFTQALSPATLVAPSSLPFSRQWFSKSDKPKDRLDYAAFLRLFPELQVRVGTPAAQACWRLFQPGDIHACLRVLKAIYTDPHDFVFDWFAAASLSFGFTKPKDSLSKKEYKALTDVLGPHTTTAAVSMESMSRDAFKRHVPRATLCSLLSIFNIFPSRESEQAQIHAVIPAETLKPSDAYADSFGYMVSMTWWLQWVAYTTPISVDNQLDATATTQRPPSVYNFDLVDPTTGNLKPHLERHRDFEVVTRASWLALMELYGGGPALPHSVGSSYHQRINVYLAECDGRPSQRHRHVHVLHPSRPDESGGGGLLQSLVSLFGVRIPVDKLRLWHRSSASKDEVVAEWVLWDRSSVLLAEVLIEVMYSSEWPRSKLKSSRDFRPLRIGDPVDAYDCERVWRSGIVQRLSTLDTNRVCVHFTGFSSVYDEWIHEESGKLQPRNSRSSSGLAGGLNPALPRGGGVGLLNLGNTCYLNCAVQCLAATSAWRSYFVDKVYAKHVNRHNKMGTKGKVAASFASLLSNMWKPGASTTSITSPSEFRKVFGRVKPQFDGCDQHDGHEFVAALLDALHEDLNCPTTPNGSSNEYNNGHLARTSTTRSSNDDDGHLARTAWQHHVERNQSIVVDLFHGLLRSQTTCGQCGHRRVQFEPTLFLSLPIAQLHKSTILRVWMHPLDPAVLPYGMEIPLRSSEGNAKMVLDEIARQASLRPDRLRLIQVQNHRFARLIAVDTLTCDLESAVLCCFERGVSTPTTAVPSNLSIVDIQVVHRVATASSPPYTLLGLPFVFSIDADATCHQAHVYLRQSLRRYVEFPDGAYTLRALSQVDVTFKEGGIVPPSSSDRLLSVFMPPQLLVVDWTSAEYIDRHQGTRWMLTRPPHPSMTLERCLQNFMTHEDIVDCHWTCESCHATDGSRQMDMWKSPDVLMLHLKRFHYSMVQHHKVQELVTFPLEGLQLRPFTAPDNDHDDDPNADVYDLYAVANHTGGLSEGHYTAYCRYDLHTTTAIANNVVPPTHIWLNFDDEVVSELPRSKVVSNAAYVLFYRKRQLSTTSVLRVL